jgi:hypothetical protein
MVGWKVGTLARLNVRTLEGWNGLRTIDDGPLTIDVCAPDTGEN